MRNKLNLDKLVGVVNYYDTSIDYLVRDENGELTEFNFDECFENGLEEDAFPETFKDFKKYGKPLMQKVVWAADSEDVNATYFFDNEFNDITIFSDNFTMKECITIINLINEHLRYAGAGQFVSYGIEDGEGTLWHEEATAFGCWWNAFIEYYQQRLNDDEKLTRIEIFTSDYQTDDERYYTKDRVINIVFS